MDELFERVQAVLTPHKRSGERDRKHQHYLKGSLFCWSCGRRLTYSRNTGRGGTSDYFLCSANQRHKCPQRVDAVEAAIEQHYRSIATTAADHERVRDAVEEHLAKMTEMSTQETERCNGLLADLKVQERKPMQRISATRFPPSCSARNRHASGVNASTPPPSSLASKSIETRSRRHLHSS
jgi:site-specific DNA recombinase